MVKSILNLKRKGKETINMRDDNSNNFGAKKVLRRKEIRKNDAPNVAQHNSMIEGIPKSLSS